MKTSTYSLVYVAKNNELLGVILFTDPLRPESTKVVESLQCQGMTTYILTGDNQPVANHVGTQLGISQDQTYAQVFPDKKVEVICSLKDKGQKVAFVGEGINDAAALAHADVSISFLEGSDIARETADVVLWITICEVLFMLLPLLNEPWKLFIRIQRSLQFPILALSWQEFYSL